jgi:DNA-binding NtrC family response regulator
MESANNGHVPGRSLLVVEDDPAVGAVLRGIFGDEYDVAIARSGDDALRRLRTGDYAAVLADFRMPGVDAPALYQTLVAELPHVLGRLIIMTGDAANPETLAFIEGTGLRVIFKPFDIEAIVRLVKDIAAGAPNPAASCELVRA